MQLQLDDCEIDYDYTALDTALPPVLFLHGALGVRAQFDGLRALLAERSQLTLDFPSHGRSRTTRTSLSCEQLARDVLALLDALSIERVDVVGHSMGGYVALVLAHLAPSRVRSIVTLGTKFYWTGEVIATSSKGLDAATLKSRSQRFHDALAAMHSACGADETLRLTQSLIEDFARWQLSEEMVRASDVPVLISAGDRDDLVPAAEVAALYRALDPKLSAMAILPATPHALQQLPLECFASLVRRFWNAP